MKVSIRGATRLQARHPWVYRSDLVEEKEIAPGSVVRVLDQRGKFLGTALYSSSSQIAIRMISHGSVEDFPALVAERIRAAIGYRRKVVTNTNAYRIVFSEADFLPGLIVDRYNDILALQILTQAMDRGSVREAIVQTLAEEFHPEGIVERVEPRIRELGAIAAASVRTASRREKLDRYWYEWKDRERNDREQEDNDRRDDQRRGDGWR